MEASAEGDEEEQKPSSPSVKKSEEIGVVVVHEAKCNVLMKPNNPTEMGWKDMGVGHLSIKTKEGASKATKESRPIVVVRNDDEAGSVVTRTYLLKLKNAEGAAKLSVIKGECTIRLEHGL